MARVLCSSSMITCIRGAAAFGLIVRIPATSDQPDVGPTIADRGRSLDGVRRILWPLLETVPDLLPVLVPMQMSSTMTWDLVKISNSFLLRMR